MGSLLDDPLLANVPAIHGYRTLALVALFAEIGRGGMGAVYRGRHLNLDIDVAVKCLLASGEADLVGRFRREAMLVARIRSPHLVQVMDVRNEYGLHYIVMEFVAGETLERRTRRRGALAPAEAVAIALDATRGLAAAHQKGVIHRDVKPGNVLISTDGEVKLTDLGIAKGDGGEAMMTLTTAVMGTPLFMPPEQFESAAHVTPASDVYSMGASLAYTLLGKHAITGRTLPEIARQVSVHGFPDIAPLRPDLPPEVVALVRRATALNPADRFRDAQDLAAELQRVLALLGGAPSLGDTQVAPAGSDAGVAPSAAVMADIRRSVTTRTEGGGLAAAVGATGAPAVDATTPRGAATVATVAPGNLAPTIASGSKPVAATTAGARPAQTAKSAKAKNSAAKTIAAVVLVLAGGGAGAWYFLGGGSPGSTGAGGPTPTQGTAAPPTRDHAGAPGPAEQRPPGDDPSAELAANTPTDAQKQPAEQKTGEQKPPEQQSAEQKQAERQPTDGVVPSTPGGAATGNGVDANKATEPANAAVSATATIAATAVEVRGATRRAEWGKAFDGLARTLALVTPATGRDEFRALADEVLGEFRTKVAEDPVTATCERASVVPDLAQRLPPFAENGSALAALLLAEGMVGYDEHDQVQCADATAALRWARMAADSRLGRACFLAGDMMREFVRQNRAVPIAKEEGAEPWQLVHDYYTRAAELGEADAGARMAGIYFASVSQKKPPLWRPPGVDNLDAWAVGLARDSARAGSARGRFVYALYLMLAAIDKQFSARSGVTEAKEGTTYPRELEAAARMRYRPALDELSSKAKTLKWAAEALQRLQKDGVLDGR